MRVEVENLKDGKTYYISPSERKKFQLGSFSIPLKDLLKNFNKLKINIIKDRTFTKEQFKPLNYLIKKEQFFRSLFRSGFFVFVMIFQNKSLISLL